MPKKSMAQGRKWKEQCQCALYTTNIGRGKDAIKLKFIRQFSIIVTAALLGEVLRTLIPLPIPAGIYGLLLMFAGLWTGLVPLNSVEGAANFLIEIMPLFFIPAGVGLMTQWRELTILFVPLLLSVTLVTALVMAATGHMAQWMLRRKGKKEKGRRNSHD